MAAGVDSFHGLFGQLLKTDHIEFFFGIQHIDQMMRNAVHLLLCDLCRADIHPPVDLHGIGGYDLAADLSGKFYGKF